MWGPPRWLGIDFSGDAGQWGSRRTRSIVWIAEIAKKDGRLALLDLRTAQGLPGAGGSRFAPFTELSVRLAAADYRAAGIDAPCGLPRAFAGPSHAALLERVRGIPCEGRPFPRGADLVRAVAGAPPPLSPPKPLRETERRWASRGVNVRSTLWVTPRGGAPMTAACLLLLARAARPVWPFAPAGPGCIAEAFPAAQLRHWGLPHERYAGEVGAPVRRVMAAALAPRIDLGSFAPHLRESADALDAVLAAFGAVALTEGKLADPPGALAGVEGWIAVHG